jgi:hypothetical protein
MGTPQSHMLAGYSVGGSALYARVTMLPGEIVCPRCEGSGTLTYDDGVDGFQKLSKGTCDHCDGAGVLEIEIMEAAQ